MICPDETGCRPSRSALPNREFVGELRLVKPLSPLAICLSALAMLGVPAVAAPAARIPLTIERVTTGVPVTFGVPFPKGALRSPDQVRVLDAHGIEIPSQITEVTSWLPASDSLQWIWVDFVTDGSDRYEIEYGPVVRRKPVESRLRIVNSQRPAGGLEVDTGAIRFRVPRGAGGFIEEASVSVNGTYRGAISSPGKRGSFLDLLDDCLLYTSDAADE